MKDDDINNRGNIVGGGGCKTPQGCTMEINTKKKNVFVVTELEQKCLRENCRVDDN